MKYNKIESQISQEELAAMGVSKIAYIKPHKNRGRKRYFVYTADGTEITSTYNREDAISIIQSNDMQPVSVQ